MNNRLKRFLPLFLITILLDQLTKWWVKEHFFGFENPAPFWQWIVDFGQSMRPFDSIEITPFLNFVVVWNRGVSFGLFASDAMTGAYILSAIALVICGFFIFLLKKSNKKFQHYAIALIIAGALSNVWDRLRFGAVYDFIDFHAAGWHYPAFNVADSAITIGVILFIWAEFFISDERNNFVKKVGRWHAN